MYIDFIRGIIQTLNSLRLKSDEDLCSYGCGVLDSNNIKGKIYFDIKRQEYYYTEKPEASTTGSD